MFHQRKMIGKNLRKVMQQLLLMFCMWKEKRYILLMFQNNLNCGKQVILLMIQNREGWKSQSDGRQ